MAKRTIQLAYEILGVDRTGQAARSASANAAKIDKSWKKLGGRFQRGIALAGNLRQAGQGIQQFSSGIAQVLRRPFEISADFEAQLSRVKALSSATKDELALLRDKAREVSINPDLQFSAIDSAKGFEAMALAGFTAAEQIKAIDGIAQAATAGGMTDLGRATDVVTGLLGGFGRTAEDIVRVNDVLAGTFTTSRTTMEGLAATMTNAAPAATKFGASMEQTFALAAVLAQDVNTRGPRAGIAIRAVLGRISAPVGDRAKGAFKGVKRTDSEGNLRDIFDILQDFGDVQDKRFGVGKNQAKRNEVLKAAFGEEFFVQAGALIDASRRDGKTGLRGRTKGLVEDTDDLGAKLAKENADNARGRMKAFAAAFEGSMIDVGDQLIPLATEFMDETLKPLLEQFAEFASSEEGKATIKTLATLGIQIAAIGTIAAPVVFGLSAVTTSLTLLSIGGGIVRGVLRGIGAVTKTFRTMGEVLDVIPGSTTRAGKAMGVLGAAVSGFAIGVGASAVIIAITDAKIRKLNNDLLALEGDSEKGRKSTGSALAKVSDADLAIQLAQIGGLKTIGTEQVAEARSFTDQLGHDFIGGSEFTKFRTVKTGQARAALVDAVKARQAEQGEGGAFAGIRFDEQGRIVSGSAPSPGTLSNEARPKGQIEVTVKVDSEGNATAGPVSAGGDFEFDTGVQ